MEIGQLHPVRWYRPDDAHATDGVPGTYTIDGEGRIEAHLHAQFHGSRLPSFGVESGLPALLQGRFMREAVILVGPRVTSHRGGVTDQCDVTLAADYALEGFGLLEPGDLAFTDVRLRFTDQDVWTGWNRFAVKVDADRRLKDVGAVLRDTPEFEAQIDGGTLRLVDGSYVNEEPSSHRWVLQSRSWFELHFESPVPIEEVFSRYAYPLQVMLMSASGRLPGVAAMAGTNNTWDFGAGSERMPSRWFDVRRLHGPLDTPPTSDLGYLHRLRDVDFDTHVPALLKAVETHSFAIGHYELLKTDRFVGGNPARFGVAAQLIDAFDRTLHPIDGRDLSFEERIKRLEDESGHVVDGVIGNRRWRREIARLRNLIVHGDVHAHEVIRDQRPLVVGYEALLLLFEVRLLVEFGLSKDEAKRLATSRVHHWTIERAITENYYALQALIQGDHMRRRARKVHRII